MVLERTGSPVRAAERVLHRATDPVRTFRPVLFGPAREGPYLRSTSDWVRLVGSLVLLLGVIRWVDPDGPVQTSIVDFVATLPTAPESLARATYITGLAWSAGFIVMAVVARRWRLFATFALTAAATWFAAAVIAWTQSSTESLGDVVSASFDWGVSDATFPTIRLAAAVSVMAVASPFVTRPTRRISFGFVVLMTLAAIYLGIALPYATIGAIVLGWAFAAGAHLAFGSPGGGPSRVQLANTLHELGVDVTDIEVAPVQRGGARLFTASDERGPMVIRVLGRDERDAQFLSRAWRTVVYRSTPGRYFFTRLADVEQEALNLLLAERAGVRVPELIVTGSAGPGAAVLAERAIEGRTLDQLDPSQVTDGMLDDLWSQVGRLHDANVVHLHLSPGNVMVSKGSVVITGFDSAIVSNTTGAWRNDVASLLIGTSGLVGTDRAIAAAFRGPGREKVVDTLPSLQSAVVAPEMRPSRRAARKAFGRQLDELRAAVADAAEVDPPQLTQLHRVSGTTLLMVVGMFIAFAAILSQIGDPADLWETITEGSWEWLAFGVVVSLAASVPTAVALMGSVQKSIPLGRTSELQLAIRFVNLAAPTVGGLATQIRFLQKQGIDLAAAVAAGGVVSGIANVVVTASVCIVALLLSPAQVDLDNLDFSSVLPILLIAVIIIAVACAIVFGVPRIRSKVVSPLKEAWGAVVTVARSPRRVVQLVVGWAGNALFFGVTLYACVAAYGTPANLWTVLLINTGVSVLAFAVPVPGGATAVGTVGVAGALTAVGVDNEVAVAASLTYQVVASFLPAVPGWFAMRNLLSDDFL